MAARSPDRERADAVGREVFGHLIGLTLGPYLVAYYGLVYALTGSLTVGGPSIVAMAVILVGSLFGPGVRWRPSKTAARLVVAAAVLLGLAMAVLVGHFGVG